MMKTQETKPLLLTARAVQLDLLERREALQEAIAELEREHQNKLAALMQELRQNSRQLDTMQAVYPLLKERAG